MSNLGAALHRKGDNEGALVWHDKATKIMEANFGTTHPRTAKSYHSLGNVMLSLSEYDGALAVFQKCFHIREVALGSFHPETADSYNFFFF